MLGQLLRGALVTQLIHVAATLGIADLLTAAGFDVRRIVPTRSPASVIEAIPAEA